MRDFFSLKNKTYFMTMMSGFLWRLSMPLTRSHCTASSLDGGGFVATLNVMH